MKRCKRVVSALVIAALAGSMLYGCGGKESSNSTSSDTSAQSSVAQQSNQNGIPSKEKKTFKIAVYRHSLDKSKNFNEKEIFIRAEKETNIHIDFVEIPSGTESEKVPIMLASDLPDAFLGSLLTEQHVAKNKDQFIVLNDLLKTCAPNITKQYEQIPDMLDMLKFPDGNIYTLATGSQISRDADADAVMFVNQKWLDKVGKKIPKTTEEFYDVLKAFKTGDPNGNGKNDEIPFEFSEQNWAGGIMKAAGAWGLTDSQGSWGATDPDCQYLLYNIKDKKFTSDMDTDNFRKFLEFYHKLAAEGLMDVEGFTQTNQQYYAKLKQNVCGIYDGWLPQSNFDAETAKQYAMVMPLTIPGQEGTAVKKGQWNKFYGNRTGFAITKECKDSETLLRWWDYLSSSTELKYTFKCGKEGKIWKRDSNGQVWTIYPETTADYTRENMQWTEGYNTAQPILLENEIEKNDAQKYPDSVLRTNMSIALKPYFKKEFLPVRFAPQEKVDERARIETDLRTYMKNFIASSIVNGIDDAKWKAHLAQLEKLNIKGWIQWNQDLIDKKF